MPAGAATTPGVRNASSEYRRPSSGRSCTCLLFDDVADVGGLCLQQLAASGDGDFFGHRADAELQIHLRARLHVQRARSRRTVRRKPCSSAATS